MVSEPRRALKMGDGGSCLFSNVWGFFPLVNKTSFGVAKLS